MEKIRSDDVLVFTRAARGVPGFVKTKVQKPPMYLLWWIIAVGSIAFIAAIVLFR